jgi:hypothetical protein
MGGAIAYIVHTSNCAVARLASALQYAGAEVYAFSSVSDLTFAASADPPDVIVGDDENLRGIDVPLVLVPRGGVDTNQTLAAVRAVVDRRSSSRSVRRVS